MSPVVNSSCILTRVTVREVSCDTVDEFMNVLTFIKDFDEIGLLGDDVLVYAEPKIK